MILAIFEYLHEMRLNHCARLYTYLDAQEQYRLIGSSYFSPQYTDSCCEIRVLLEQTFKVIQEDLSLPDHSALYFGGFVFNPVKNSFDLVTPAQYFENIILISNRLSSRTVGDFETLCEIILFLNSGLEELGAAIAY